MDTSFFAQFTIGGVSVPDLRDQYLHWSLGTGSFSKARRRRLELGVPKNLTVTGLHGSDDYAGSNDYSLSVRRDDRISLLRITHRDADDGAVSWHNIVRLSGSSEGCRVEHAVVRSAPRGVRLIPRASSPAVVSDIIATYSRGGVTPRDLYKGNIVLSDGDDAAEFVRHVLLDRDRRVPILVVTSSARTERPVVMPRTLTAQLRGMAVVAELTTRDTTEALTDELQCEGLDRQFTCFDGGVRLYMPDISTDDALYQSAPALDPYVAPRPGRRHQLQNGSSRRTRCWAHRPDDDAAGSHHFHPGLRPARTSSSCCGGPRCA
jgi:hypothetical protein